MFTVREVEIDEFWHRLDARCSFNDDVNIIIGRNGTGKTTFMNILHAALTVDLEELAENDFTQVKIKLAHGKKSKLIKVQKNGAVGFAFQSIDYKVSNKKYSLRAIAASDEARIPISIRKRILEESANVRAHLSELISISSLSVYRLKNTEDYEIKDRSGKRLMSPVDFRLMQLRSDITKYQYELSLKAREVSSNLQKDVLTSILYGESVAGPGLFPEAFDKNSEQRNLLNAYQRLGASDFNVQKKISFHVLAVDEALQLLNSPNPDGLKEKHFAAVDAYLRTRRIVDMSLRAEEKTLEIYSQLNLFTETLKEFIPDKNFTVFSGELKVSSATHEEEIPVSKLSSGEKQLIILLAEALLQRGRQFVYLADEPELSLHIEWQRKILPAVKKLNPSAQIIAATHSPEVASKYRNHIIDMKDVVNGRI